MHHDIKFIDESGVVRTLNEQIELEDTARWARMMRRMPPDMTRLPFLHWPLAPLSALMRDIIKHKNEHEV